jgi:hypothetical protein
VLKQSQSAALRQRLNASAMISASLLMPLFAANKARNIDESSTAQALESHLEDLTRHIQRQVG